MAAAPVAALAALAAALLAVPAQGQRAASTCRAARVTLRLGPGVTPMTGEHAQLYALRNGSRRSCTLVGYPSVRLLDRQGRTLPLRIERGRGPYVTSRRPRVVLLRPGRRAWFLVAKYRCDRGDARRASRLVLALGGVLRAPSSLALCRGGAGDPGNALQLSPFVARAEAVQPG